MLSLERQGLVTGADQTGKRMFDITEKGKEKLKTLKEEIVKIKNVYANSYQINCS